MSESPLRCGRVAVVGRPNAGKSTFLNTVLGQKVSITSARPQTTRTRVVGICNLDNAQIVIIDTPGHHEAWTPLNKALVATAENAMQDVDAVLLLVDLIPATRQAEGERVIISKGEKVLLERVVEVGRPVVLGLNKVDAVPRLWTLPVIEAWSALHSFTHIIPMSARDEGDTRRVLDSLIPLLPVQEPLYPTDQLMDGSERFLVAEILREQAFHLLREELPYAVAVQIEQFDESLRESEGRVEILARLLVERDSQKGIVIGKGGEMLKRIGTAARKAMNTLLDCRVHLELHVSVAPSWSSDPRMLRKLGLEE